MAVAALKKKDLQSILAALPSFLKLPARKFWVDYDEEADVLYLSFRRPQHAKDSELLDDGVIVHTDGHEVVGVTIMEASSHG